MKLPLGLVVFLLALSLDYTPAQATDPAWITIHRADDAFWAKRTGLSSAQIRAMRLKAEIPDDYVGGRIELVDAKGLRSRDQILFVMAEGNGHCLTAYVFSKGEIIWSSDEFPGVGGLCRNNFVGEAKMRVRSRELVATFPKDELLETEVAYHWDGSTYVPGPSRNVFRHDSKKQPQLRSDLGVHKLTDATELASADLDCDGKPERVVMGASQITRTYFIGGKDERHTHPVVVIAVPESGKKFNAVVVPFMKETGYYGFCAVPQKSAAEVKPLTCGWDGGKLPGCDPARRCEAVAMKDACIDMIVFWDRKGDRLSWVRKAAVSR